MDSIVKKMILVGVKEGLSSKEIKRIKVLNVTAYVSLIHAIFFLYFDYYTNSLDQAKLITLILEGIFFSLIIYLQQLGYFKFSRILFTVTVFSNLFFHCNYAFKGYYGEYQYLVIPLFSLFFFDKRYIHYGLLILSIIAFYVPNYYLNIYPEQYFGYLNVLFLFTGIFLIINFFKNVNERNEKKLAKQLLKNQQMKQILDVKNKELQSLNNFQNHFFVNIAHEMGTPITLIKGQAGLLAKKMDRRKEHFPEIHKLNYQIDKLEGLLYNIRDIAKMEAETLVLDKKNISVNKIAQKGFLEFQPLFEEKGINLSLGLFHRDLMIEADVIYLERVLSNVLSNAFKYTEKGGQVDIKVNMEDNLVSLIVADNGIGVPLGELTAIFERFYQSHNHINKANGSGIGLAFVQEIIKLHGGKVKAYPNAPNGLVVQMDFNQVNPIQNTHEPLEVVTLPLKKSPTIKDKTILLVEDNTEMRYYLKTILSEYTIIESSNGKEALAILNNNTPIDAIITDFMMPEMDGEEFVKILKEKGDRLPIIMITARLDVKSKLKMLRLGVDDYLNKPFMEEELLLRLNNCIRNYTSAQQYRKKTDTPEPLDQENKLVIESKALVLKNIHNAYFGVAQLSDELKVSERTLHRNLKKETGLSPIQFIRELKLLHVREIVENNKFTSLQELALSVGLSNGTYLNQLYKERFGRAIQDD
ncbi:MAG: hypothetical protein CMO01_22030 [Thalassobius sp.]|nr:hypothetical protein [Thalassovita sp.]